MKQRPRLPPTQTKFFAFNGGLDLVTPTLSKPNGTLSSVSNMEIGIAGGYKRIAGYERFDGLPKPSDAVYYILPATITGSYATGNTLTGATSGATGIIATTGAAQGFVLTKVVGTYVSGENLQIAAATVAVATATASSGAASTPALNASYLNLAATQYRSDIGKVPGSGSVLGVFQYGSLVYAFRNNAGATAAVLHKSSASGWAAVTMYNEVSFTVGNVVTPLDAAVLTQGGVTATIQRVVTQSGAWSGTAAGRFIITNPAGGNFAAGAATISGGATVTLTAIQTAITFLPSGRFEFDIFNFGGQLGTRKVYGCDGKNRGFEFDGTTLVPISTGMTVDIPTHVAIHKFHLFFSFASSAQHSGIATPYIWTIISGAAELGIGDTVTAFLRLPGGTGSGSLAIYAANSTHILYGNNSTDWNLVPFDSETGSLKWTTQYITQGVSLHSKGLVLLSTTQAYGNFQSASISNKIKPYLNDLIPTATASCIVRDKNQYRLFFSGGDAVYVTLNAIASNPNVGTGSGAFGMTVITLPDPVLCIASQTELGNGEEIYFGSSSGYVFQMDVGTSFDGGVIAWHGDIAFNHCGTPRTIKTFLKGVHEVSGNGYCEFSFNYSLSYASTEFEASVTENLTSGFSGGSWDSGTWDALFWDGRTLIPSESPINGDAENISLIFQGSSAEFVPFQFDGEILQYIERRLLR